MKTRIFHVSDEAGIEVFHPRRSRQGRDEVWAIAEDRLQNYLLPRDCPRVTFYANADTTDADRDRFLIGSTCVVAIEDAWFERCRETTLYLYEFDPAAFHTADGIAAYHTARESVRPIACSIIDDIFAALRERNVELRLMPTLWPLREAVATSTLAFSIIRMRDAGPVPGGFVSAFPVPKFQPV